MTRLHLRRLPNRIAVEMIPPFIPSIGLSPGEAGKSGLDLESLSYIGAVHAQFSPESLEDAFRFLQQTVGKIDTLLDVTLIPSIDDVVSLLDGGASKVLVSELQLKQLEQVPTVDRGRAILSVESAPHDSIQLTRALHFRVSLDPATLSNVLKGRPASSGPIFMTFSQANAKAAEQLVQASLIPIIPAENLTVNPETDPDLISASRLLTVNAVSDRADGLLTTLVTDERGTALGLVYSNEQSVAESLKTGRGVYHSRKRGLWYKGNSSGDIQELVAIGFDCDSDCLRFVVRQKGRGFCHLGTATCFGDYWGLSRLQQTLQQRKSASPEGSYTARLFQDANLLNAKLLEEANELCEATEKSHIAFEAADLLYFALTKCVAAGVTLEDVERNLDAKSVKVKRRKGDAKPLATTSNEDQSAPLSEDKPIEDVIRMTRYITSKVPQKTIAQALQRPSQRANEKILDIVRPIIKDVRANGDKALLEYTHKFEKAISLKSPVINAPFAPELMQLPPETIEAIDVSFENVRKFHAAQKEERPLEVETMPGVMCSRFWRPIERVGLYVPGGTAVLPSSALMLGVPAMVAGCKKIILASPPRADGSVTPEIVYIAHKVGAESIVLAGGAQAIAAMAYGTESVSKVDKILGPGNQFVTAGKMVVSNDTSAGVSIDMPAGPSEVLVVADGTSNPAFVASDLLSQAEHGHDSQVVLIAVAMTEAQILAIENELHSQAMALPRVDIVRGAIDHSVTLIVDSVEEAMKLANQYAPEHLILQVYDADAASKLVENAGSVFIGPWTPESVGDYSAGVNHSLPTYGYAKQYSGVNLSYFIKHITSSKLTKEGLRNVGGAVMQLAKVEELEAHRRAVSIRLSYMDGNDVS